MLFTFYIQSVLKLKKNNSGTKRLTDRITELIAACRENGNKINLHLNKLENEMNSVAIPVLS